VQRIHGLIRGVYSDLLSRLQASNSALALNLFPEYARPIYDDIFGKLGTDLPTVANQLGSVLRISASEKTAELILTRQVGGDTLSFAVYLLRGGDGIWRIESM
jgi:hypothetical protein